jgi:hypothetical protein
MVSRALSECQTISKIFLKEGTVLRTETALQYPPKDDGDLTFSGNLKGF